MTRGRIAALVGPEKVEIKSFDVPEPEPGAVVLGVRRANVCGSDVHQWHYESPALREAGLGHEFVGEVVALGEGVETDFAGEPVAIGDRVVAVYYLTCHRCGPCLRGQFNLCTRGLASWSVNPEVAPHFRSGFATHYYVQPGQFFYKVPDRVDDAATAGANCGLAQMLFVLDALEVKAGETLVVQGAGGLGLYATAAARERGVRVIVVDGVADRLELARRFGAARTVDMTEHPTAQARAEVVREATGGADAVLEATGVSAAFAEAIELARPGGRIASVGNLDARPEADVAISPGLLTRKSLTVKGVLRYDPNYLHRAVAFLARNPELPLGSLAGSTHALDEVVEALHRGEQRSVARVAIVP